MYSLELENESGNIVNLNDGIRYEILSASGLTPPSASIFTAKSPNRKGSKYNGSTLNERNIVITIKLHGNIEENRNALYAWVDPEQYVKVHYKNGVKDVFCEGHIEDCPIELFTDNEIVNVAILCESPYWKELQEISADISALLKQFVFPFAIDTKGVPLSTYRENYSANVYNAGAATGARFVIRCNGTVKNPMIYDATNTARQFKINYTFEQYWIIEIDTDASPKTVKAIKPDGTVINLMRYIAGNPIWFELKKGNNAFGFSADSGQPDADITIEFRNKYLGV